MLNELLSSGTLSYGDFQQLEDLFRLRNIIVHGFSVPAVRPDIIPFLASTVRRLLAESAALGQAS